MRGSPETPLPGIPSNPPEGDSPRRAIDSVRRALPVLQLTRVSHFARRFRWGDGALGAQKRLPEASLNVTSRRPAALLIAGTALIVLAAAAGGDLAGRAMGAMAVVALLGFGAVAMRRARGASNGESVLSVLERHPMAKDTGVAVLVTQGRRLVVGYGSAGVALLAELGPTEERLP